MPFLDYSFLFIYRSVPIHLLIILRKALGAWRNYFKAPPLPPPPPPTLRTVPGKVLFMYLLPQSTDVCSWYWITECSTDWTQYGSHCYKVFQVEVSWDDARQECLDLNSDLASITNIAENSFIKTAFLLDQTEKIWIGLNDREKEDEFHWSDGTPFNFSSFISSDPKQGRHKNCVLMRNDGKWFEQTCSLKKHYICKKRGENNFY